MGEEDIADHIQLTGFRDIDDSTMEVVKKTIIKHNKRIAELTNNVEELHITLKKVHEREKSEKYEVHAKLVDNGRVTASEAIERNLFSAIDAALEKLIHEID